MNNNKFRTIKTVAAAFIALVTLNAATFGQIGDKPQPGDFDKDGKTDIAFWRPSNGNYFVLRSSNNSFFAFPWGANGDVPIGSPDVP